MLKYIGNFIMNMLGGGEKVSSTRVAMLITVLTILGIFIIQNINSILRKDCTFIDFPENTVMVLLIALGAKVGQHVSESVTKKKNDTEIPKNN